MMITTVLKKRVTNQRQTNDKPTTTNNNVKNNKKNKNIENNTNNTDSAEPVLFPETVLEVKKKVPSGIEAQMIDFWLKDFHPTFTFEGVHRKSIKSIETKLRHFLKSHGSIVTDESVLKTFKSMCLRLPDWYKDKDLLVINSKFNEITTEILKNPNGQSTTKTRTAAYDSAAVYRS